MSTAIEAECTAEAEVAQVARRRGRRKRTIEETACADVAVADEPGTRGRRRTRVSGAGVPEAQTAKGKPGAAKSASRLPRPASPNRVLARVLWEDQCIACARVLSENALGNFCGRGCQLDFLRRKREAQMDAELARETQPHPWMWNW